MNSYLVHSLSLFIAVYFLIFLPSYSFSYFHSPKIRSFSQNWHKTTYYNSKLFCLLGSSSFDDEESLNVQKLEENSKFMIPATIDSFPINTTPIDEGSSETFVNIDIEPYLRLKSPNWNDKSIESCIIVAVDSTSSKLNKNYQTTQNSQITKETDQMTIRESLKELQELIRTAGLQVLEVCVQRLPVPLPSSYIGSGKVGEIIEVAKKLNVKTLIFDDDLTTKQQRTLEDMFSTSEYGQTMKILDRTAIILEIFAKRANSREAQLQIELAMLEYRLTRGPRVSGDSGRDNGAGFRGPGETKLETDKRVIKDKLVEIKKEIEKLKDQRQQRRMNRTQLGLPVVTLCGYTNAGKSTLMNRMSKANVLAEDMLFATLDTTTRKVKVSRGIENSSSSDNGDNGSNSSWQMLLTDTVGFISKLPASLVAAFRSTLEEVNEADVLVHVVDRSNPTWRKQRQTVMKELRAIMGIDGIKKVPIIELWNKIDKMDDPEMIRLEAATLPIDIEGGVWNDDNAEDDGKDRMDESVEEERKGEEIKEEEEDYVRVDVNNIDLKDTKSTNPSSHPSTSTTNQNTNNNIKVVAISTKTGLGMDDFYATLIEVATTTLVGVDLIIPYAQDNGIVATIHSVGVVEEISYTETSTVMSARIPESMIPRVKMFIKQSVNK